MKIIVPVIVELGSVRLALARGAPREARRRPSRACRASEEETLVVAPAATKMPVYVVTVVATCLPESLKNLY